MTTDTQWLIDETLAISESEYQRMDEQLGDISLERSVQQDACQLAVT